MRKPNTPSLFQYQFCGVGQSGEGLTTVTGFGKTLRMGPRAQLFYKRFYCLW